MLPHLDLVSLIISAGYVGIFCVICAESWLLVGFFLPGDSLLFTAGVAAAGGWLDLWVLMLIVPAAAVLGDTVGYWLGSWVGPKIFTKEDSFVFNKRHVARSEEFYQKYGPRAVLLARFVPVVRTFVPLLAGVGSMRYPTFLFYNLLGGALWGCGMLAVGYFLGTAFPAAAHYLLYLTAGVVALSLLPLGWEWLKYRRERGR